MNDVTVREAFEAAVGAEKAVEKFFLGLEAKFCHNAEISWLWKQYAKDETMHARWLEALKARLAPDDLSKPVDGYIVQLLQAVARISVEKALDRVHDLEDACELVNEIENGETNAIFQFLVDNFETDEKMRDFLRAQLNRHVARLSTDMPPQYRSAATRRAIKASV